MPPEPQFEFLFEMQAFVTPQSVGETPHGNRLIVVVQDGSFEGPRLKGKLLPGGGDWALIRPDGVGELDVRLTLQTDDDALIYMSYRGYLISAMTTGEQSQQEKYLVVTPYFETSAPQYTWLQRVVCVGIGIDVPEGVGYRIYAIR